MKKTVFISSTYEDLKEHRRKLWDLLTNYQVNIRGMEKFGARKESPLQVCLAEVEQSDIFVGIIGCRLGTIDAESSKSFVQLEYERAYELDKEIFIYFIDERNGKITPNFVDVGEAHYKLQAFKSILKERHTIDNFIDEIDLSEKLARKFNDLLAKKAGTLSKAEDEYKKSYNILQKFLLLPGYYSGQEIKLRIKFNGSPFPASKAICKSLYLNYGRTIGIPIQIIEPNIKEDGLDYLFIDENLVEQFFTLNRDKELEIYVSLKFTVDTIDNIKAHFFSKTYTYINSISKTKTMKAEGQLVLLLKDIVKQENLDA